MTDRSPRILIAEDDRFLRKAAEAALRRKGYDVVVAADGEEALDRARDAAPDLILLDVIMPKLQGFDVLERLKADPATRDVPVIMMSNLGQDSDIRAALDRGALSYLVKSNVRLDELAAKVGEALAARNATS
jgi:CheY-like chemotaxis protein